MSDDKKPAETKAPSPKDEANKKLATLVKAWPADTPNEKVVFGYGPYRITVGDIRAAHG